MGIIVDEDRFFAEKKKNKEFGLAVPCCLPDIKCGSNLAGRCMNRNKACHDGAWFRFVHTELVHVPIAGNVGREDNKFLQ